MSLNFARKCDKHQERKRGKRVIIDWFWWLKVGFFNRSWSSYIYIYRRNGLIPIGNKLKIQSPNFPRPKTTKSRFGNKPNQFPAGISAKLSRWDQGSSWSLCGVGLERGNRASRLPKSAKPTGTGSLSLLSCTCVFFDVLSRHLTSNTSVMFYNDMPIIYFRTFFECQQQASVFHNKRNRQELYHSIKVEEHKPSWCKPHNNAQRLTTQRDNYNSVAHK